MSARKAAVKQADIIRALKAARDVGMEVARYEISRDGTLVIYTTADGGGDEQVNDWDRP